MSFKIVVAQPLHRSVLTRLRQHGTVAMNPGPDPFESEELMAECRDAQALMAFMTERIDDTFLEHCRDMKIIAGALKGSNNIDIAACSRRGIAVTVVPDLLTAPTAELTVGLMIAAARNMCEGERHVRSGSFKGWRPRFYGGSLAGATVLMIGAGAVGRMVMRMLAGFDCKLLYVDKVPLSPEEEAYLKCQRVDTDTALPDADFVVLGVHLLPETQHMVDDRFLERMQPGSYLINPARGSLVDEHAVIAALERGHLAGYAADTFEMEDWARRDRPKDIPQALLQCEQATLMPHIGSAVARVREEIELSAATSIIEAIQGKVPMHAVNKDAIAP